jgi:hypothetical protein
MLRLCCLILIDPHVWLYMNLLIFMYKLASNELISLLSASLYACFEKPYAAALSGILVIRAVYPYVRDNRLCVF